MDVPCSETVGVDGRLRENDDNDGCPEACISTAAERADERSVTAEAGAASLFGVVVVVVEVAVVSRSVLARRADAQSGDFAVLPFGVLGSDSSAVGVATIFGGKTCGFGFAGDASYLSSCARAAEMSNLVGGDAAAAFEGVVSSKFALTLGLGTLTVPEASSCSSLSPEGCMCKLPVTGAVVLVSISAVAFGPFSVVSLSKPAFGEKPFLASFFGLGPITVSLTFTLREAGR